MDSLKRMLVLPLVVFVLTGCELLCQAGSGTCGLSDEQVERLLHPKGYGEYWTKASMTKESWRQDWVACKGRSNGSYTNDAPDGSTTAVIRAASRRISEQLGSCMHSKGYEYRYTGS